MNDLGRCGFEPFEFVLEGGMRGVWGRAQIVRAAPPIPITAIKGDTSAPLSICRARRAQGACTEWRFGFANTPKLQTVSHSGLGAMRILARSSVERWIVIKARALPGKSDCSAPVVFWSRPAF